MKKRALLLGMMLTLAVTSVGCGKKEADANITEPIYEESSEEAVVGDVVDNEEEEDLPDGKVRNELTGELIDESLANQRPIAVMVDNESIALPHYGLTQADVVYEMMNSTENGRITRFMALVKDWETLEQFGSIRSARVTNCILAASGAVTEELVCSALGLAGERRAGAILMAIARQDAAAALRQFSELYAAGKDISALLDELLCLTRDLLMLKTAPKGGVSMLSGVGSNDEVAALREQLSAAELLRMTALIQQTMAGFARSQNRRVDAELCILQLCRPAMALDAQALSARIGRLEEQLASGVVLTAAPAAQGAPAAETEAAAAQEAGAAEAAGPAAAQPAPQEDVSGFWPELSAALTQALGPRERGFFAANGPVRAMLSGDTLQLVADSEFVLEMIRREDVAQIIRSKAAVILKRPVGVRFALKGQAGTAGEDPMDALVRFGGQHQDIFTIQ